MDTIKKLDGLIDRATNQSISQIPSQLLKQILELINSRVDMPKHVIAIISKRIIFKNRKVLINIFTLLEYLCYQCQHALYSQISTKQFLNKINGLLLNRDLEQEVKQKILETLYCWNQLFKPHEDLLPIFFQFYAGVLRNGFEIPVDYQSKYRGTSLKIEKKQQSQGSGVGSTTNDKKSQSQKECPGLTALELKIFQQIKQELILTNEIIDNSNPVDNTKQNGLLLEMIEHIKQCEKKVKKIIKENSNDKILQFASAANDDIQITYRRFKDLQKNKKPQPFILTQLVLQPSKVNSQQKKANPQKTKKCIFDVDFQPQPKSTKQPPKKQMDIFDNLVDTSNQTQINYIPQPVNQKNTIYQQKGTVVENQAGFDLIGNYPGQTSTTTEPQSHNMNSINFETLTMNTQNYQNVTLPPPSEYGVTLNANDFRTEADIKNYNNQSALDRLEELTYKFLKK